MSLHGSSESFGFTEILQVLAQRGKTGRLVVRGGSTEGAYFFDEGRLSGMMGRGGAAIAPVSRSEDDEETSPWPEAGMELTASLLRAPHTAFVFEPEFTWPDTGSPSPRGQVSQLLEDGQLRVEQWKEVEKVVPSLELRPTLVVQISAQVVLEPEEWRLLTAIDGRRSVSALARAAGLTPLAACQRLVNLLERGLIALEAPAAPRATVGNIVQLPEASEEATPALPPPPPDAVPASVLPGDAGAVLSGGAGAGMVQPVAPVDGSDPAIGADAAADGAKGRRWQRKSVRRSA